MRTTIRMDDHLMAQVKARAAQTGKSITEIFEEAIRSMLALKIDKTTHVRIELKTFKGNGVCDGVDLDDSGNLLEIMDPHDSV